MVTEENNESEESTPGMLCCARLATSDTHHFVRRRLHRTAVQSAHSCGQDEVACGLGAGRLERPW